MRKKINSFTVLELIVGLILTSIIVGMAFFGYSLIAKKIKSYSYRANQIQEYNLFRKAINSDFDDATCIRDSAENCIAIATQSGLRINYFLGTNNIIRSVGQVSDSFSIAVKKLSRSYAVSKVRLISSVKLKLVVIDEVIPFALGKRYSATELMNAEKKSYE